MKLKKYKAIRLTIATAVLAAFSAMCVGVANLGFMAKWQLIPALPRTLAGGGFAGAAILAILLLTAIFAGRWYCALWCPVGIFTDIIDLIPFRWKRAEKRDLRFVRAAIVAVCVVLALAGINGGFLLLDPYSNFGRIAGELSRKSFTLGMVIPLIVLTVLSVWKRRFFCTTICPAGAILNLASRKALCKLALKSNCVKCRMCEKSCPAGCIDITAGTIDNGRCVRCLACLDVCKFSAIGFSFSNSAPVADADLSRREFLKRGSAALSGAVAGGVMLKLGMEQFASALPFSQILPPGAGNLNRFSAKCTSCLICVQHCPQKIIRPAIGGDGPVSLDLTTNSCAWDCNICSAICPTGALKELNLPEKQRTQIALAVVGVKCVGCTACVTACPAKAISMDDERAAVDPDSCVGCGKCVTSCPVKVISMNVVPVQKTLPERETVVENSSAAQAKKAFIDSNVCFSCGSCAEICPTKAIVLDESDTPRPVIRSKCIGCGKCVSYCQARAISMR